VGCDRTDLVWQVSVVTVRVEGGDVLPFHEFGGEIFCVTSSACSTHSRGERGLAAAAAAKLQLQHTISAATTAANNFGRFDINERNKRRERRQTE